MFNNTLSERLTEIFRNLTNKGRLTEDNIQDSLREVRVALLEADVALPVVKQFIDDVRTRAIGQEVIQSLSPGQALVNIVHKELIKTLGEVVVDLNLSTTPPAVILMAGLQGSGKTTTVAKLARHIKERKNKKVLVTSTDIYRPAAIEQLAVLAKEINAEYYPSTVDQNPIHIATSAIDTAKRQGIDVVIIDTAGRLHIDDAMMQEIKNLHGATQPIETLFVVDSMTGQDAANTAKAFNDALPLTGIILTKTDGDARGGAALAIKTITGKPIKFIGVGEKTDAFEVFHPDRIASRILGMGDVLSLIEEVEQKIDKKKADELTKKLKKGKGFDLQDFNEQLQQMNNMEGGMFGLIAKIPGISGLTQKVKSKIDDKIFKRYQAIINSMTPQERKFPHVIKGSRKRRIATGSGAQIQEVNRLLKQFDQMQKMMKKFSSPGKMQKLMQQMQGMLPPR